MICDHFEEVLPLYLDGEASAEERRFVEQHLAICSSCRVTLRNVRRVDAIVASWPDLPDEMRPRLAIVDEGVRRRIRRERLLRPTILVLRRTLGLAMSAAIVVMVAGLGLALLLMGSQFEQARQTLSSAPSKVAPSVLHQLHLSAAAPTPPVLPSRLGSFRLDKAVVKIEVMDYRKTSARMVSDAALVRKVLEALGRAQFVRHDPGMASEVATQTYVVRFIYPDGSGIALNYLPGDQGPNIEDPRTQDWWAIQGLDAVMQPLLPNPPILSTRVPGPGSTNRPTAGVQPSPAQTTTPEPAPTQTPRSAPVRRLPAPAVSLAAAPGSDRIVYALLVTNELYRSDDEGQTWRQLSFPATIRAYQPSGSSDQLAGVFLIPPHNLWVSGGNPERIFVVADRVLYGSDDGGASWKPLNDSVYAWTVADAAGDVVYVWHGTAPSESSGLYRTTDGGNTWQEVYSGAFPPFLASAQCPCSHEGISALAVDPHNRDTVYAGTDYGVYRSVDGGRTWEEVDAGMPSSVSRYRWTPILSVASDGTVYGVTEVLPNGTPSHGEVVVLRPGESAWKTVAETALASSRNPNAPLSGFETIATDAAHPSHVFLGTSRGLLVSDDAGATWRSAKLSRGQIVYEMAVASGNSTSAKSGSAERLYLQTDAGFEAVSPATR